MMREFPDATGLLWVATPREEQTPRHHTRWYLVFHPQADAQSALAVPEVRWQTRETGERTLDSMSLFELRRRLDSARRRRLAPADA
jgi:hypothetical protein